MLNAGYLFCDLRHRFVRSIAFLRMFYLGLVVAVTSFFYDLSSFVHGPILMYPTQTVDEQSRGYFLIDFFMLCCP